MKKTLIISMLFLMLASCTTPPEEIPSTSLAQTPVIEKGLDGTKWKLLSFGEPGAEKTVIGDSSITLIFDAAGQAGGSGGCNSYGAEYETQENIISFSTIISTLIACESEGIGEQERLYFQALESSGRFELTEDRLTIWYNDDQGVLNWQKEE